MKVDCPVCQQPKCMDALTRTEKIPYFGEIMESVLLCNSCGYRHTDVICLEQKDPVRYSLKVKKDRLSARVVKSQSATVSIPELGLKVEPGPKSLGYVSNIEGVLERFQGAVKTAMNLIDDEESQKNGSLIMDNLKSVRSGEKSVEIIIEDPFGQSFIAHPHVEKRELTPEEIKELKTGFATFEQENIE